MFRHRMMAIDQTSEPKPFHKVTTAGVPHCEGQVLGPDMLKMLPAATMTKMDLLQDQNIKKQHQSL